MGVDDALGGLARLSASYARCLTCSKALRDSTKAALSAIAHAFAARTSNRSDIREILRERFRR
jgi:hypothetical protein